MKTFDWKSCFKQHPVFWDLAREELDKLLDDNLTREVICQPDQVVVREGQPGDSVFFVGQGEVNVVLQSSSGPPTEIAILGPGEFFGEMAVLEDRPRMATVVARDNCVLLEIDGSRFREFLIKHPEIEFKIAAKLSQRLRDVTEHVLTARFKDVDQKLQLFNTKLESELRVIDASMKATQAVFDQTNRRANEIIESAERSRNRLTATVTIVAGALAIVVTVLGFLGVEKVNQVEEALSDVKDLETSIERIKQESMGLEELEKRLPELESKVDQANQRFSDTEKSYLMASIPVLATGLKDKDQYAIQHYEDLLRRNDSEINTRLFKIVYSGLFDTQAGPSGETTREVFVRLLEDSIKGRYLADDQELISYYLMLSGMVLAGMNKDHDRHSPDYKLLAKNYRNERGKSIKDMVELAFAPDFNPDVFALYLDAEPAEELDQTAAGRRSAEVQSSKDMLEVIWRTLP